MMINCNIIITDDDPVTIFLHTALMRRSEVSTRPITFSNAMDTLRFLEDTSGSGIMNLIFLDINMPKMSGWDLLDRIKESEFIHVLVALVSSSVNSDDHRKSASYDCVIGYLEKPLSETGVRAVVASGRLKEYVRTDMD